ncbi:hypothetical protein [Micromonospora sp. DT47]|uniref:hypothetical protein n=1 Tax=Micromonospora sp. DT47 TaxID=3393431 RepID=UPI003CE82274
MTSRTSRDRSPGTDEFALSRADGILGRHRVAGPFAEPARRLLAARADYVERMLGDFDRLVGGVRRITRDWVVTHG